MADVRNAARQRHATSRSTSRSRRTSSRNRGRRLVGLPASRGRHPPGCRARPALRRRGVSRAHVAQPARVHHTADRRAGARTCSAPGKEVRTDPRTDPWQIVPGSSRRYCLSSLTERGLSERRRMSFARLRSRPGERRSASPTCTRSAEGQLHPERESGRAARAAVDWAGRTPLVLGGDFNLRPVSSNVFEQLERDFGLTGSTDAERHRPPAHSRSRGGRPPPGGRTRGASWSLLEVRHAQIRLSDHPPIEATVGISV